MNTPLHTAVFNHLKKLGLKPEKKDITGCDGAGYAFNLSPGVPSEIFCRLHRRERTRLITVTSVPFAGAQEDLALYASMVSPFLAPFVLHHQAGQLSLRLLAECTTKSLARIIDEIIVATRQMAGTVFTPAIGLNEQKYDLNNALENMFEHLRTRLTA